MESVCVLSFGLLFLINTISKIKHSSFPGHFLRTLKFLIKLSGVKACWPWNVFWSRNVYVPVRVDGGGSKCTQYYFNCANHMWIHRLHFPGLSGEAFLPWLSDDKRSFCLWLLDDQRSFCLWIIILFNLSTNGYIWLLKLNSAELSCNFSK